MSKKGRQIRALKKQQKQINKLQRRLRQAGAQLDLKETNISDNTISQYLHPKKQIEVLKKYKHELQNYSKDTITTNKIKPSQKQLSKAIQQRKTKTLQPAHIKQTHIKIPKEKQRKNIQKKQQKVAPKYSKPSTELPENLLPPTPEQPIPERVNTNTSFYAEAIISNYRIQLKQYPAMAEPMLSSWLDSMIAEHGVEDVATMLQAGADDGNALTFEIAYSTEKLEGYVAEMLNYLPEMTDWYKAEIMEQFESWEGIYD